MSRGCVFYYFDMEISKLAFWNIILNWNQFHIASPGGGKYKGRGLLPKPSNPDTVNDRKRPFRFPF